MKIALHAHNWHYIDLYEPVIAYCKEHGIPYDVIIYQKRNESYEKYGSRTDLIELLQRPYVRRVHDACTAVPLFGDIFLALFLLAYTKKFLRAGRYSVVVTSDDRALLFPLVLLFCAMRRHIPAILYPIETNEVVEANYAWRASGAPDSPSFFQRFAHACMDVLYPESVAAYKGRRVYFYIARYILPLVFFRFLNRNPWIRGGNQYLARVAVNSSLQLEENIRQGIPAEKMVLTGTPTHDVIARVLESGRHHIRNELARRRNFSPEKKIFLIIGTHLRGAYSLEAMKRINEEFRSIFDTIPRVLGDEYVIICKVHPNLNIKEQVSILNPTSAQTVHFLKTEYTLYELIGAADVILSFGSSAIAAALATSVPVCTYRPRDFSATFDLMHEGLTSVELLRTQKEFDRTLGNIKDGRYSIDPTARMRDRSRFGLFDGHNTDRFLGLLWSLDRKVE